MESLEEKVGKEIKNPRAHANELWSKYRSKAKFFKLLFIVLSLTLLIGDILITYLINSHPDDKTIIEDTGIILIWLTIIQLFVAYFSIFDGWKFNNDAQYSLYKDYKKYIHKVSPYDGDDRDDRLIEFLDNLTDDEHAKESDRMKDKKDIFDKQSTNKKK